MPKSASHKADPMPGDIRWLLAFQIFNAINFTLALGAPLVLTARYLGASETEIGFIGALTPLLVILQLTAPIFIERIGYRRLMITGWGSRSFMLLLIAPLPFLVGVYSSEALVLVMIAAMFGFNFIRGITSAAWFPWLSEILPASQRGNFLGREQRIINISAFVTLVLFGFFLGEDSPPWKYSAVFLAALAAGLASASMLVRVPEKGAGIKPRAERTRYRQYFPSMIETWRHQPFRRTLRYVCMFTLAMAAQPVFLVLFVYEELQLSEGMVLKLQAGATLGVLLTSVFWGRLSDSLGSRPLLRLCDIGVFSTVGFWLLPATGIYMPELWMMFVVYFLGGIFMSAHAVAQSRLVLSCCPSRNITIGMALFQVSVAMCGGIAPIFFGGLLEWIRPSEPTGGSSFPFVVLFTSFLLLGIASQFFLSHVPEKERVPTRTVLLRVFYGWPMRVLDGMILGGKRPR